MAAAVEDVESDHIVLRNGVHLPRVGFGTFRLQGEACSSAVQIALESGYQLVDTADVYRNHDVIAQTLKSFGSKASADHRETPFLTTKIAPKDIGGEEVTYRASVRLLQELDVERVGLLLLHWPGTGGKPADDPDNKERRLGAWRALVRLYREGRAHAIGVSNFEISHLQEIEEHCKALDDAGRGKYPFPYVNQCECHPLFQRLELRKFCRDRGCTFQAYSSLGSGTSDGHLVQHKTITEIAQRLGKSPAQVLLRWALQSGLPVIPKASSRDRITNNRDVFGWNLAQSDLNAIDALEATDGSRAFTWGGGADKVK